MPSNIAGGRNPNAKLGKDDVLTIRRRYAEGVTQRELCQVFGVSHNTIARIIHRQTWGWLDDEGVPAPNYDAPLPPMTPEQEQAALESAAKLKAQLGEGQG